MQQRMSEELSAAIIEAQNNGETVECRVLGDPKLIMGVPKLHLNLAMDQLSTTSEDQHLAMFDKLQTDIKRYIKRMKQKRLTQEDMEQFGFAVVMWLAHELMYSDGERHLVSTKNLKVAR